MIKYNLTPAAEATLVDIYVYTHQTWGLEQADTYLDGLYERFGQIAAKSCLWRPVPVEYKIKSYFTRFEKHLIYWRVRGDDTIVIVAILHTSMLQFERLKKAFGSDTPES